MKEERVWMERERVIIPTEQIQRIEFALQRERERELGNLKGRWRETDFGGRGEKVLLVNYKGSGEEKMKGCWIG
jgi:hypothetical protein